MTRHAEHRLRIKAAHEELMRAICAMSIGDCDPACRTDALKSATEAWMYVRAGIDTSEKEYKRDEAIKSLTPEQKEALAGFLS